MSLSVKCHYRSKVKVCVIVCHCVSLCVIVCHCVSLGVIVCYCVSLCVIVCHCVSLCVFVCHCVLFCVILRVKAQKLTGRSAITRSFFSLRKNQKQLCVQNHQTSLYPLLKSKSERIVLSRNCNILNPGLEHRTNRRNSVIFHFTEKLKLCRFLKN